MPRYFVDSSALAKRYLDEPGTRSVIQIVEQRGPVSVSAITEVEIVSAGVRRNKAGELGGELLHAMVTLLARDFRERFEVLPPSNRILTTAVELVQTHALRAADAIQLATALQCASELSDRAEWVLVSSDGELNDAARREGLAILDPRDE